MLNFSEDFLFFVIAMVFQIKKQLQLFIYYGPRCHSRSLNEAIGVIYGKPYFVRDHSYDILH